MATGKQSFVINGLTIWNNLSEAMQVLEEPGMDFRSGAVALLKQKYENWHKTVLVTLTDSQGGV